jgi:hypothetical protein
MGERSRDYRAGCRCHALIVGFQNSEDIKNCFWARRIVALAPFGVFNLREWGSAIGFATFEVVLGDIGPCEEVREHQIATREWRRCREVRRLRIHGRSSGVWIARATENLG